MKALGLKPITMVVFLAAYCILFKLYVGVDDPQPNWQPNCHKASELIWGCRPRWPVKSRQLGPAACFCEHGQMYLIGHICYGKLIPAKTSDHITGSR